MSLDLPFPLLAVVSDLPEGYPYPFANGDRVLLLGEISNMPDHIAVATRDGKVHFPYHPENFRVLTQGET